MITSTGHKPKGGSLILLETTAPEDIELRKIFHELETGMFIALSAAQLDLVRGLLNAILEAK
jgi:hypothetical protein